MVVGSGEVCRGFQARETHIGKMKCLQGDRDIVTLLTKPAMMASNFRLDDGFKVVVSDTASKFVK